MIILREFWTFLSEKGKKNAEKSAKKKAFTMNSTRLGKFILAIYNTFVLCATELDQ